MTISNATEFNIGNEVIDEVPKTWPLTAELGQIGLKRSAGILDEEFLPQLQGRKLIQVLKEMSENDPIVGALLFAMDKLLRGIDWNVEPFDNSPEAKEYQKFVEECMDDMSHTWDDFISEVLSCLVYGWSWHEIVWKRRVGPWEEDGSKRSKFNDNKIGIRKLPIRAQETHLRWIFNDRGEVQALVQMAPPYYNQTIVPLNKSLLFRTQSRKGSPEGRSILRNAYQPWFYKKRLQEIEAIGVERDLAGLPVARVPRDYLASATNSEKAKILAAFRKMVKSVRRNEQEGLIIPGDIDPDSGKPYFDFELLTSGGSRQFDTNAIIQRYEQRILMSVLADFILVGHEGVGSYALHTDKTGMFRASVDSISEAIAETLNRHLIPRLFLVNGTKTTKLPKFVPSKVDPPDLGQLASFMNAMSSAGVQWFPDPEMERFVRRIAQLPELQEDAEKVREQEYKQANVLRLANQQVEALTLQGQVQQQIVANEQPPMPPEQPAPPGQPAPQQPKPAPQAQPQNRSKP
jgi:phage gp29-like protein